MEKEILTPQSPDFKGIAAKIIQKGQQLRIFKPGTPELETNAEQVPIGERASLICEDPDTGECCLLIHIILVARKKEFYLNVEKKNGLKYLTVSSEPSNEYQLANILDLKTIETAFFSGQAYQMMGIASETNLLEGNLAINGGGHLTTSEAMIIALDSLATTAREQRPIAA
ncbi:MAG: hypothetical protein GY793_10655 [Proteobacteria bacterium]|nr:hypothetical protein [Pseudomonadota bacterium]